MRNLVLNIIALNNRLLLILLYIIGVNNLYRGNIIAMVPNAGSSSLTSLMASGDHLVKTQSIYEPISIVESKD